MRVAVLLILSISLSFLYAQEKELEVEGGIKIGDVQSNPEPGTIRWSGLDFEGWNGEKWVSLTDRQTGPVTYIQGNSYSTVSIGDQIWMSENLRATSYNDGTPIPKIEDNIEWAMMSTPAYCYYNNDSTILIPEAGALYNYFTVADTNQRNVCPAGWHVPSNQDWTDLTDFLEENGFGEGGSGDDIAGSMSFYGSNKSGFSVDPNFPYRKFNGDFVLIGIESRFWTSTIDPDNLPGFPLGTAYYRSFGVGSDFVEPRPPEGTPTTAGNYVRCIKDSSP